VNPERGLSGMLTDKWAIFHDQIYIKERYCVRVTYKEGGDSHFPSDTPTLALLKALAHQEGIEI